MSLHSHIHSGNAVDDAALDSMGRVLIVTAVDAEREAVLRGLAGLPNIDVIAAGVGSAAAAAGTAAALASPETAYRLVISMGIGGGFIDQAAVASLVVADLIVAADLGAESPEGFLSLDELGFGSARVAASGAWNNRLLAAIQGSGLSVCSAPILTVTTATGTAETASLLAQRIKGAAAEAMEGHGVAVAAERFGIPVTEIRAISNAVGPRDRSAWRIGDALAALEAATKAIREVLS
ncbi:futalosine hydrolase [Paenibacillus endophyticus]|uniref:Futalosine hydrolase n=1 Tax=Paenibacillus endophyticus TaxID=1294268 RepID=A0A7W5C7T2_9BACL|nr:futalosine hydrolase [Paenibacillus endophyticus]MBB3152732.1 futalosine hydrolase [Paenibacillus endophyticus]